MKSLPYRLSESRWPRKSINVLAAWRPKGFLYRASKQSLWKWGAGITFSFLFSGLFSFLWVPHSPYAQNIPLRLAGPSLTHWLGTDGLGRDVFFLLVRGGFHSLLLAFLSISISASIGVALGLYLSRAEKKYALFLTQGLDFMFSFPLVLMAVLLTSLRGASVWNVVLAVTFFNIPIFARMSRAVAEILWRQEFVYSASLMGKANVRIAWNHILPNLLPQLLVCACLQLSVAILIEASLTYVGLGVQPPTPSLGKMLYDAQAFLYSAPHLALCPGLAIVVIVGGIHLLAEGFRHALQPQSRKYL